MQFGNINYLFCLWLIPALILFYVRSFRVRDRLIERFVSGGLEKGLVPAEIRGRQKLKSVLLICAVIFMIIALTQPRLGFIWEDITRRGVDIIIAVDVSASMLAEDVKPNRIERAKREISDLLRMVEGDRIGLIAFAGTSFVQCPLTLDYNAVQIFLSSINTDLIPVPGTAVGDAIRTSLKSFSKSGKAKSKALILITDGEDHEGEPVEEAKKAKDAGVKIFAIGIGKEGGVPIPNSDGKGGFKKDGHGDLILTKLDELTLQRIALETGGSYVRSVTGDLDLEQIYINDIKKNMEKDELKSTKRKRWEERFQWFVLAALVLISAEFIMMERRKHKRRNFLKCGALCVFAALFNVIIFHPVYGESVYSQTTEGTRLFNEKKYDQALEQFNSALVDDPGNALLQYNVGNTYYNMQKYDEAAKAYLDVATAAVADKKLKEQAYYNIGNSFYRQGKLDEAVGSYKKALELNSDDEDAKFNLEFTLREIERREQQQQQEQKGDKGEEKEEKEQHSNDESQQQDEEQGEQTEKAEESSGEDKEMQEEKDHTQMAEDSRKKEDDEKKEGESKEMKEAQSMEEMSEEEALRWLDSLKEERTVIKNRIKQRSKTRYTDKDW